MSTRKENLSPRTQSLTTRELDILDCLARKMSNRQIAEHLVLAESTVKWYVRQLFNKLGVNKRRDAVARAYTLGLLGEEEPPPVIRHNVPHAMTPFIGRQDELAKLAELVADSDVRLITIIGPGGMGKTRLAMEVARQQIARQTAFPDGVFFVPLAPLQSADEMVGALIATFDLPLVKAVQEPGREATQLLDYLAGKKMLLVLDNFEHLLEARSLLTQIATRAGAVKMLVTSRERLQMSGEQLFFLQGLDMPESGSDGQSSITSYAATQLFLKTSKRLLPDFTLRADDTKHLLRICRLVDGMPLGIEHAASWAGMMSLSGIAEEIERNLNILKSEYYDMPDRHRSMQATLDISWRRLNADQQVGFQKLTVFRGSITRMAAAEVADVTLPLLVTLANKSWLTYDRAKDRYTMHELQRQFGFDKLQRAINREQKVRQQHSAFFCRYLKKRETLWFGGNQEEALADIRSEIENIRQAWHWASAQTDVDLLTDGLNSLCHFYLREGRLLDGQRACQLARAGLEEAVNAQNRMPRRNLVLLSRILAWECDFVPETNLREALLARSQAVLDLVTTDTRVEQAYIHQVRALTANHSDYEEAVHQATLSLTLYRELGDRWGESEMLKTLGINYMYLGQYEQSADSLRQALVIKQELNDFNGIAEVKSSYGVTFRHLGDFEAAEKLHREALALLQKLGNRQQERWCLATLSYTLTFAGKFAAAFEIATQGVKLDRHLGLFPDPGTLNPTIFAALHLGRYGEAKRMANESLLASQQRGELMNQSWALMFLSCGALVERDLIGARRYLLQSIAALAEIKHIYQSLLQALLGYVARLTGDDRLACEYLMTALRLGIDAHSVSPVIYCLPLAALLAMDEGDVDRAVQLYGVMQRSGHIMKSHLFGELARDELSGFVTSLPTERVALPLARGREADLWATVEQLLRDLSLYNDF